MPISTHPSRKRLAFPSPSRPGCALSSLIGAEALYVVREPLAWTLASLEPRPLPDVYELLVRCERGTSLDGWKPPSWLLPHQVAAAQRLAASLRTFGGALLADAVGMGKTYVALAVAGRYPHVTAVVPACLQSQWSRVSCDVAVRLTTVSHELLSRGGQIPASDLVIIDEAHRLRNRATIRYDRCARTLAGAHVLALTATPVVNGVGDLLSLLRLFLPDSALAFLGVPTLAPHDDQALAGRLARAVTRLTVARPAEALADTGLSLPAIRDGTVIRAATAPGATMALLERALDELTFPGVPRGTAHLLRAHVWHRLASSSSALRETLRRHLAYTDRALTVSDTPPRRRDLRFLLGPGDDLQLELAGLLTETHGPAVVAADLAAERHRLLSLLQRLPCGGGSPKSRRLAALLGARPRRAIVFCGSVATAHELARDLSWRRLAVVAGGRAKIASGPVALETALDLFAPVARRSRRVADGRHQIELLIATDLVSEGLDLQDADTVIHYDLPWTPVRVAQRIGRIARLGSVHSVADVHWFAPPASVERRLQLEQRLARKVALQLALAVPSTSAPGRARLVNATLAARELLCAAASSSAGGGTTDEPPALAIVRGPPVLAAGVRWTIAAGAVDELLMIGDSPPRPIENHGTVAAVLEHLRHAPPSSSHLPSALREALLTVLRRRLRAAVWPDPGPTVRRLKRDVIALGHAAGKRCDAQRLELLNEVLDRLQTGQRVGAIRILDAIIADGGNTEALSAWLRSCPSADATPPVVRVLAVLAGDGSESSARGCYRTTTCSSR
jgi:hypothetical protein